MLITQVSTNGIILLLSNYCIAGSLSHCQATSHPTLLVATNPIRRRSDGGATSSKYWKSSFLFPFPFLRLPKKNLANLLFRIQHIRLPCGPHLSGMLGLPCQKRALAEQRRSINAGSGCQAIHWESGFGIILTCFRDPGASFQPLCPFAQHEELLGLPHRLQLWKLCLRIETSRISSNRSQIPGLQSVLGTMRMNKLKILRLRHRYAQAAQGLQCAPNTLLLMSGHHWRT